MRYENLVGGGENLIPDGDVVDQSVGVKRKNVNCDPRLSGGELGEGRNVTVCDGNSEGDAGTGEGTKDILVGVKDLDAIDGGLGFEEGSDLGRRREVVGNRAIVDADGVGGGGKSDEEREEAEEEREKWRGSHGRVKSGTVKLQSGGFGIKEEETWPPRIEGFAWALHRPIDE